VTMSATNRNVMSIGSILNQGSTLSVQEEDIIIGYDRSEPPSPIESIEEAESSKSSKKDTPKQKHKRCKTGCQTCRNRRVKCDEAKPRCESPASFFKIKIQGAHSVCSDLAVFLNRTRPIS
jgi:hypothetical protein